MTPESPDEPYDLGFYSETGQPEDRFAFRTPPLRNVTVTGPWMHNGAYATLRGAVMHHLNPKQSLNEYRANQLARDLRRMFSGPMDMEELAGLPRRDGRNLAETVRSSRQDIELVLRNLDPQLESIDLNEEEVDSILAFLRSLTSPDVRVEEGKLSERLRRTIPDTVPSGLPVAKKKPF